MYVPDLRPMNEFQASVGVISMRPSCSIPGIMVHMMVMFRTMGGRASNFLVVSLYFASFFSSISSKWRLAIAALSSPMRSTRSSLWVDWVVWPWIGAGMLAWGRRKSWC